MGTKASFLSRELAYDAEIGPGVSRCGRSKLCKVRAGSVGTSRVSKKVDPAASINRDMMLSAWPLFFFFHSLLAALASRFSDGEKRHAGKSRKC